MRIQWLDLLTGAHVKRIDNTQLDALIEDCSNRGFEVLRCSTLQDGDQPPQIQLTMHQAEPATAKAELDEAKNQP